MSCSSQRNRILSMISFSRPPHDTLLNDWYRSHRSRRRPRRLWLNAILTLTSAILAPVRMVYLRHNKSKGTLNKNVSNKFKAPSTEGRGCVRQRITLAQIYCMYEISVLGPCKPNTSSLQ